MKPNSSHARFGIPLVLLALAPLVCLLIFFGVNDGVHVDKNTPQTPTGPFTLEYPKYFGGRYQIPENNPMSKEGVALGRLLFYEPKLSANNQISCASCHQQKLAFTDGRPLSIGFDGSLTTRNSMSLANLLWVRQFFWDGRVPGLEAQAIVPMTDPHEMGQDLETSSKKLQGTAPYPSLFRTVFGTDSITGERIALAIAQFERTLISDDSPYDRYLKGKYTPTPEELRGLQLFESSPDPENGIRGANCAQCHGGPKTYLEQFHNNGLDIEPADLGREGITNFAADRGRFRIPTLRNIAVTGPYMHDGRFTSLEEVIDHYNHRLKDSPTLSPVLRNVTNDPNGAGLGLTDQERKDLLAFLHMLTDTTFLNNPKFSNPHKS